MMQCDALSEIGNGTPHFYTCTTSLSPPVTFSFQLLFSIVFLSSLPSYFLPLYFSLSSFLPSPILFIACHFRSSPYLSGPFFGIHASFKKFA